jgi:hypothetical protein
MDLYSAVAALAMGSPFLAILLILAYYYLFQVPWRRRKPESARRRSRFSWSSAGVGAALIGLTLIYRPRLHYAIEAQQRQVEDAEEDDNGDPDSPKKHLLRQLRRIRRGEHVENLVFASPLRQPTPGHADTAVCGRI